VRTSDWITPPYGSDSAYEFDCESLATLNARDGGSSYIQPLFWMSRCTLRDPEDAAGWAVDRLELFWLVLDNHAKAQVVPWLHTPDLTWRLWMRLRSGQKLSILISDAEDVHYSITACPHPVKRGTLWNQVCNDPPPECSSQLRREEVGIPP
jgi:hypothetical protein